jgi:hypothetical protein
MSSFILVYKFISCVYINSTYTYDNHRMFCCTVVAFCAVVMPLVYLMYVLWVLLICIFSCLYFHAFTLHILLTISASYWVVFGPCKVLLNVNNNHKDLCVCVCMKACMCVCVYVCMYVCRHSGDVEVHLYPYSTSAPEVGDSQHHALATVPPGRRPIT